MQKYQDKNIIIQLKINILKQLQIYKKDFQTLRINKDNIIKKH